MEPTYLLSLTAEDHNPMPYSSGGTSLHMMTSISCYFFPEVRQERLDILLEVSRKGVDGLLIGCCRQAPMLLYHPEMVKTQQQTGINPLEIDASTGETYNDWITWRANFFTQLLRDLSSELVTMEKELGKKIPVAVRIPATGFFL